MVHSGFESKIRIYLGLLKGCMRMKALSDGKQVHDRMVQSGAYSNMILGNTLIEMYAKCGSVEDAQEVFDKMALRNLFSWTAIISAYAQQEQVEQIAKLFQDMQCTGLVPDKVIFMIVLNACGSVASLQRGKEVHAHIVKTGYETDASVGKNLVEMYKKWGRVRDAHKVFDNICHRDVILWTAMISGYVQQGLFKDALALFEQMESEDVKPNGITFVSILKACTGLAGSEHGKKIHAQVLQNGFDSNALVGNSLIDMYVKCGGLENALQVFDRMCDRDVVSWTTLIAGHAECGLGMEAFALFEQMEREGMKPNHVTYISILKVCNGMESLTWVKQIHVHIITSGFHIDLSIGNSFVDSYAKSNSIEDAQVVFDKMPERNVVSWTAMISGYVEQNLGREGLKLAKNMQMEGIELDRVTFVSILKACASLALLDWGTQLHTQIIACGFDTDMFIGSMLLDMYAHCGRMDDAFTVFKRLCEQDVVSWTAIIAGYSQQGLSKEAFALFEEMEDTPVKANSITLVNLVKACTSLGDVERGMQVHGQIIKYGFESDVYIVSSLVDMYAKCGSIEDAHQLFNNMHERDVVLWNAMITGYVQAELFLKAFVLFEEMQSVNIQPDYFTSVAILRACTDQTVLERGKQVHSYIIVRFFESDVFVASTLIDMYAKCGSVGDAYVVFNKMDNPDLVSWNAIIGGYAQQGLCKEAIMLFERMQHSCIKPDKVTFECLLSACSYGGLLDTAYHYFNAMSQDFNTAPLSEHYACMVDLLGRAGHLDGAEEFIVRMPTPPDVVVWMTFLGACRRHDNLSLGRRAFEIVIKLEPKCAVAYVLLSNIYAAAGRWDDVVKLRKEMGGLV